jgi:hypothetical protein
MNEWKITARSHTCQSCGNAFKDKEVYHTFLFEKKSELVRFDICDACWRNQGSSESSLPVGFDKKGFISYWQGVYEVPPPPPPEPIRKETAETMLRKLIELNNPEHLDAIFILAVMLERKKLLKIKKEFNENGKRIFVYEHVKTGDVFTIADPELDFEKLGEVQNKVARLLEHGLEEQTGKTEQNSAQNTASETVANQPADLSPTDNSTQQEQKVEGSEKEATFAPAVNN